MGEIISMCCNNRNYEIKSDKNNLDLSKNDLVDNHPARKKTISEMEIYLLKDKAKSANNKGIIEKHLKDNSVRINTSTKYLTEELNERIKKLSEVASQSKILKLKVVSSNTSILKGTELIINCQGLMETNDSDLNRRENDGFVYFGYLPSDSTQDQMKILDFNFPPNYNGQNTEENNINIGRHFQIEYKIEKSSFFIRDLGIGYGTFSRIEHPYVLKDNQLINIGETFILANINEKNQDISIISNRDLVDGSFSHKNNYSQLKLKIYGVNNNGETFYFPPIQKNIIVGRYSSADVVIDDKLLSKMHFVINYSEKEGWIISDGYGDKPSTNGTWLYINEDIEIYNRMIFKSNQIIFQCYLSDFNEQSNQV